MLCFREIPVAKRLLDTKGGRSIKSLRRKSFVSENRKLLQGNPSVLAFRKLPVAKKFLDKRGFKVITSKNFCLGVPKFFRRKSFSVSLTPTSKKVREWRVCAGFKIFLVSLSRKVL